MKQRIALFSLLVFVSVFTFGQKTETKQSKKAERENRPSYIELGYGSNFSSFRDFATSPLMYNGHASTIFPAWLKFDLKRETKAGLIYSFGNYSVKTGNIASMSTVNTFSAYYTQLRRLNPISNDLWNFKVGGSANMTANLRSNEALQNNSVGKEFFVTILGTGKVTRDISRTEAKSKKFLWMHYNLKPRKKSISFQLNLGLVNMNYRNPYVYSGQSQVINQSGFFDDYKFSVFSGFRMSSALDYTIYLKNENALRISYVWDAYKTGGDLDKFEMAHHVLKFAFLFNTK